MPPDIPSFQEFRQQTLGLSQETLANQADVHRNTIKHIENGMHVPEAETRARILAAIDDIPWVEREISPGRLAVMMAKHFDGMLDDDE